MLMLLSSPIRLSSVELMIAGLDLQALWSGRDHATLLLGKKSGLLLLQLPLLLLQFLLLQELDLCINVRDGVHRRSRGHHIRGYTGVRRGIRHGVHLVVHGCRQENRSICSTHGCVECLTVCDVHHAATIRVLEVAEVKLQALRQTVHAGHIEKLLKVVFGAGMHGVALVVPSCGLHHGHGSDKCQSLDNGNPGDKRALGPVLLRKAVNRKTSHKTVARMACGAPLPSVPGLGCRRWWRNSGGGRRVCAAQLRRTGVGKEGGGGHDRARRQDNVGAVTQHAVRRHEQRLKGRRRRQVCRIVAMP